MSFVSFVVIALCLTGRVEGFSCAAGRHLHLIRQALVNRYCTGCHSTRMKAGDLVLAGVDVAAVADNPELWEKVVRKLRAG